jgi:hypothetical protein
MPDTTLIAIAGIVGTASSPVIAHFFTARRDDKQRDHDFDKQKRQFNHELAERAKQFEHEQREQDRREIRELLDEFAMHLAHADSAYRALRHEVITHGVHLEGASLEAARNFNRLGEKVDEDRERLAIRLGRDHSVCKAHEAVAEGLVEVAHPVGVAIMLGGDDHSYVSEMWDRVEKGGADFRAGREQFVAECVKRFGSRAV